MYTRSLFIGHGTFKPLQGVDTFQARIRENPLPIKDDM